jgi:alkyl sulfatase BDS1-like metallo-beta-lactamase superfamily hydrolase
MPFYATPDHLYSTLGETLTRAQTYAPGAAKAVIQSKLIIQMLFTDPQAELLVNGRRNPFQIEYGATKLRPELELRLAADTFHQILLKEIEIKTAVARGMIKVRGPVWRLASFGPVIEAGQQVYPLVLQDLGN